jgi:hypothetical protein
MLVELILTLLITYYSDDPVFLDDFLYIYFSYIYFQGFIIIRDDTIRWGALPEYYRVEEYIFNIIKYIIIFIILLILIDYYVSFYCTFFDLYSISLENALAAYSLCAIYIILYDFLVTKVLRAYHFPNLFYIAFSGPMIVGKVTRKNMSLGRYTYTKGYTPEFHLALIELYLALVFISASFATPEARLVHMIFIFIAKEVRLC